MREGIELYRAAPSPALTEWAKQGVEVLLAAQKRWTENASHQSTELLEAVREARRLNAAEAKEKAADCARQGALLCVGAQRHWLEFAA